MVIMHLGKIMKAVWRIIMVEVSELLRGLLGCPLSNSHLSNRISPLRPFFASKISFENASCFTIIPSISTSTKILMQILYPTQYHSHTHGIYDQKVSPPSRNTMNCLPAWIVLNVNVCFMLCE